MRTLKFDSFRLALICLLFIGLGACDNDKDEPVYTYEVSTEAIISCSHDLLEFVTPHILILNNDDVIVDRDLSISDFTESKEWGEVQFNNKKDEQASDIPQTLTNNVACIPLNSTVKMPFKQKIYVHYSIKQDYIIDKDSFFFFHSEGAKVTATINGRDETKTLYEKPIAEVVNKDELNMYLNRLTMLEYETDINMEASDSYNFQNAQSLR